jgi:hypothetical protein
MKRVAFLLSLAIVTLWMAIPNAHAQTIVNCFPKSKQTPLSSEGTQVRSAKSDLGRWAAWWCGAPDPATPGKWKWRLQSYAVLAQYGAPLETAITESNGDFETWKVYNALLTMPSIKPAAGSMAEYQFKTLRWSACKALATKPYDVVFDADLPANFCGEAPTPPGPGTIDTTYEVSPNPGSTTRPAYNSTQVNGVWTRGSTITGTARVGEICDCNAIQILELGGLARYCKFGVTNQVTGCRKKP